MWSRFLRGFAVVALIVLTGCARSTDHRTPQVSSGPMTLSIVSPKAGQTVYLPFEVKVKANVPLGNPATGEHHIHIWFDNNRGDYNMFGSDNAEITSASFGPHTVHVSLNNPDHTPTGIETSVEIEIVDTPAG